MFASLENHRRRWQISSYLPLLIALVALALSLGVVFYSNQSASAVDKREGRQALAELQDAFTSIAEEVEPSVVGIHVEPRVPEVQTEDQDRGEDDLFREFRELFPDFPLPPRSLRRMPRQVEPPSSGSGIIVRRIGNEFYILTNWHVIESAVPSPTRRGVSPKEMGKITVSLSDNPDDEVRAEFVGADEKTDLAVIKVRLTGQQANRQPAQLGDSDKVKIGQWAIAIGNPLDIGITFTVGVISAKGRDVSIPASYADYRGMLQTDAAINPGNSGGPLVDIEGRVIGINTAIATRPFGSPGSIGIGFAIPINVARDIMEQLITRGEVIRGWLGVQTVTANRRLRPEIARLLGVEKGALVDEVFPGSPADKAGIKPKDVIIQWGDRRIESFDDLERAVATTPPGVRVPLKVIRNKREITLTVVTEKRPPESELKSARAQTPPEEGGVNRGSSANTAKAFGVTVRNASPAEQREIGGPAVVVQDVQQGTPAASRILEGDAILEIEGNPVRSVEDFRRLTATLGNQPFVLQLSRKDPDTGRRFRMLTVVKPE